MNSYFFWAQFGISFQICERMYAVDSPPIRTPGLTYSVAKLITTAARWVIPCKVWYNMIYHIKCIPLYAFTTGKCVLPSCFLYKRSYYVSPCNKRMKGTCGIFLSALIRFWSFSNFVFLTITTHSFRIFCILSA